MTVEEQIARQSIRDAIARYNFAGDRGRLAELAACFREDGVLEVRGAWTARGRDAIEARLEGVRGPGGNLASSALVRHHITTHLAEFDSADFARAWTYFLVLNERGPDHAGRYVDRFERISGVWLIAHRSVVLDWRSGGDG